MDLASELGEQGFKWIMVVHVHGSPLHIGALDEAGDYFHDTYGGRMVNLWGLLPVIGGWGSAMSVMTEAEKKEDGASLHGGADEHSLMLHLQPNLVSPDYKAATTVTGATAQASVAAANAEGWPGYIGAPRIATAELGRQIWNAFSAAALKSAVDILNGTDPASIRAVHELHAQESDPSGLDQAGERARRHLRRAAADLAGGANPQAMRASCGPHLILDDARRQLDQALRIRVHTMPVAEDATVIRCPVGFFFVRGDRAGPGKDLTEQVVASYGYWNLDAGKYLDMVFPGWGRDGDVLVFNREAFLHCRAQLEAISRWRYSGETDVLLFNVELHRGWCRRLPRSSVVVQGVHLASGRRNGARQPHQAPGRPDARVDLNGEGDLAGSQAAECVGDQRSRRGRSRAARVVGGPQENVPARCRQELR